MAYISLEQIKKEFGILGETEDKRYERILKSAIEQIEDWTMTTWDENLKTVTDEIIAYYPVVNNMIQIKVDKRLVKKVTAIKQYLSDDSIALDDVVIVNDLIYVPSGLLKASSLGIKVSYEYGETETPDLINQAIYKLVEVYDADTSIGSERLGDYQISSTGVSWANREVQRAKQMIAQYCSGVKIGQ